MQRSMFEVNLSFNSNFYRMACVDYMKNFYN